MAAAAAPPPPKSSDAVPTPMPGGRAATDVLVLGAGVVGIATAYALARRGLRVAIADRSHAPARGCSFANGAQLSYAYTDALAAPALLAKLPGLALGLDPAFRIRLRPDPDLIRWGLRFLRNCNASGFTRATLEGLKLGLESREAMQHLLDRHPLEFGHRVAGKLHLLRDEKAMAAASPGVAMKRAQGIAQDLVDAAEARRLEPALDSAGDLAGAIYSPDEEVGDPHRFANALLHILVRDYQVETHFGFDAIAVDRKGKALLVHGRDGSCLAADRIVVALGPSAAAFAKTLGIGLPIVPMKGYSFTASPGRAAPRISITDGARKIVFCALDGRIRVAGLAELGNGDPGVDPARLDHLVRSARASLPEAADYERLSSGWTGLRPMTPSSLPIVAEMADRLFVNVGHGMLGWTFAMGSGERAAALVAESLSRHPVPRSH
jgi:D-amino-acid dehydrogenase